MKTTLLKLPTHLLRSYQQWGVQRILPKTSGDNLLNATNVPAPTIPSYQIKGARVEPVSEVIRQFFEVYEQGSNVLDLDLLSSRYNDSFMFAGPQGVQAIKKEDFL